MGNLNVAVLGKPGFASRMGKKGTSSDITFYNLKRGDDTVTFIEPTKYPERLAPLFYAVSIAKMAVLAVEKIDATFGETVLMLHSAGVGSGYIVPLGVMKEKVAQLVKGTLLEGYEVFEGDVNRSGKRWSAWHPRELPTPQAGRKGGAWRWTTPSTSRGQGRSCLGRLCKVLSEGTTR